MDLVKIVDGAMARLPDGDYSQGLKAVRRHIIAAIRHYENDNAVEDSFTDAIYRTNQAFEGGLKEAYRVLTSQDPARRSPYEIENYLEQNDLIRPRALKQLTRYREDYRNPSTHDYRLDFDADEALLAIVSVCAFTKLLVNQISGKLAYDAGALLSTKEKSPKISSNEEAALFIAKYLAESFTKLETLTLEGEDLDEFIAGAVSSKVDSVVLKESAVDIDGDNENPDVIFTINNVSVPLEIRHFSSSDLHRSAYYLSEIMDERDFSIGILVIVPTIREKTSFVVFDLYIDGKRMLVVSIASVLELMKGRTKLLYTPMTLL